MKNNEVNYKPYEGTCPVCGRDYVGHPVLSLVDSDTFICPECGQRQALESIGVVSRTEQDYIIKLTRGAQVN